MPCNLITILGPTACGKTKFAANLACRVGGEIISADSRQVYKNMNIGTGKDYADYMVNGITIPSHLVDIVEPGYQYSVFEFQKDFIAVFDRLHAMKKIPVLCGGTGMYIESVLKGYRLIPVPENTLLRNECQNKTTDELIQLLASYKKIHNTADINTRENLLRAIEIEVYNKENQAGHFDFPLIDSLTIGIKYDREIIRRRITERLTDRLKAGMIEEVGELLKWVAPAKLISYGLEYKFITLYIQGTLSHDEMFEKLNTAIHQFAKRQMTWFRRMEKNGIKIMWLDENRSFNENLEEVISLFEKPHSC